MERFRLSLALSLALAGAAARAVDFEKDLRPILERECYECHSEERGKEKGGYVFDNLARMQKDIDLMLLVMPGNPAASNMFKALVDPDAKNHMPPESNLADADLEKVRKWIADGAKLGKSPPADDPGAAGTKETAPGVLSWTNNAGVTIQAGFGGLQGDGVILKLGDGRTVTYPLAKLSPASRKQAEESAAR
jgi:hypothetical protein